MFSSRQLECGSVVPGEVESTEIIWTTGHRRPPFRTTHTRFRLALNVRCVTACANTGRPTICCSDLSGLLLGSANAVKVDEKTREMLEQPKLVKFLKMGMLLPKKRLQASSAKAASAKIEFGAANSAGNVDRGMKTPTKVAPVPAPVAGPSVSEMSMDQIKAKLSRSTKLAEDFAEQAAGDGECTAGDQEKPPPSKVTPVTTSPTKVPAYQRFQTLADSGRPALQLLYKYRYLGELFKCIDTVCAMFHNRKKQITFRKLKPAVQRMARKNFYENRLAQNNTFNRLLLAKAKDAHETFLLALDLPMRIAKEKSTRWIPEFDLESCRTLPKCHFPCLRTWSDSLRPRTSSRRDETRLTSGSSIYSSPSSLTTSSFSSAQ
ncbi:hypothetical protein pipiens_007407 [Culex pipiens pipiens]|uniref:CDT1 Geminin-binding domain-containing protein n=1 Tax=Culex pipiens pipiens TaxID=38569 RepID=A0ABD1DLD0_CULPP